MIDRKVLLTPGPVVTSDALKALLAHPDMSHRQPAFEELVQRIRRGLLTLLKADTGYTAAIVSGSGTAANEMALSSLVGPSDEVLLVKNGEFGNRLEEILCCYGCKLELLAYPWGRLPEPGHVQQCLVRNPRLRWVCMVWHETSTGMLNPVREVGAIAHEHGRMLFADCVSAVGGEDINVVRDEIDACSGVPNKAISGMTGASFIVARRAVIPLLGPDMPRRNVYLNLQNHIDWADRVSQTPFTPSVTMFVALDGALQELQAEGLGNRIRRYQACARIIRDGVRKLGLRTLLPDEQASNTVTSVFLPEGIALREFVKELAARGYVVYPGKGPFFAQGMFQIANMGSIWPEECKKFLGILERTLVDMGAKV